ncbi:MAG: TonB-dependent receptor [Thermoanaerobaculia bacterium]
MAGTRLRTLATGGFIRLLTIIAALAVFLALPLQAQVDRAVVEISVTDSSGAALPGVTVTVTRPETGYQSLAVTAGNGTARVPSLSPGTYEVAFTLEGFAPVTEKNLVLRVGQTARLNIVLNPATSESITVTAQSQVVDVYKSDDSTNIVPEAIQSLPVADRDFQRLAFIAPGVQRERGDYRFIGGGPVLGSGSNASQATILVDGVDFTDPALGLARTRFSQDAIREFRVIANRFDTEIGGSAGGALSIVTKSGTNDVDGTVFGFYRDKSLRAKGALEQKNNDFSRGQYGFTVGGPIILDRLHYFVSTEFIDQQTVALFRPGGAYAPLAADVNHPMNQTLAFAGLDSQFGTNHTGAAKFVYEKYQEDNFRVGGISDVSYGQQLNRDNWNVTLEDSWVVSSNKLNEARFQAGSRKYDEPPNAPAGTPAEWFSSGNTLQTGTNILGNLLGSGDQFELRDTFYDFIPVGKSSHDLKAGFSAQRIKERSRIDTFQDGLFVYYSDDRSFPLSYLYGVGSADVRLNTTRYGAFVEDSWRPNTKLMVNLGLRYDLDTNGNNPGFHHTLVPNGRKRDTNNWQPRLSFTYDLAGNGANVIRGGVGKFIGRFILVPAFTELQQNGETGRLLITRVNGLLFGLPAFALDPAHPTTTGIPLKPQITLLDSTFVSPESTQTSLGYTMRLGHTGLYLDAEGIYAEGTKEIVVRDTNWGGNSNPVRPNANYDQINTYTNQGHSVYKAAVLSLNGTLPGGHLLTSSITLADKKNISDDFSPVFPFGYPNDPANIEAEYGRSRADERYRVVLSGVFKLPWKLTVAPIYEYGSGQPWNLRLGYDYNGDGKNSDRPAGVGRNSMDGPAFQQLSLRVTKTIPVGSNSVDLIAEAFNLTDVTNYDVSSIDAAKYLAGPTLANPTAPYVANPSFGKYRATLPSREIQLGVRWAF